MNFTKQDHQYLRPPKEVFEVKHADDYISRGEGNQSLRKIFNGVQFTPFEQEKLAEFKKIVQEHKLKLPEKWSEADYMRYVYSGRFNMERCLENLKTHLEWRADPKRGSLTEKAAGMLRDGIVYISGRDKQFRPIIVVNVYKYDMKKMDIEDFIVALTFVLDVAINYYFVPGKVENWILIVETNAISVFNFPFQIFKRLMQVTGANYPCTSEKMFVTNPSRLFNASWSIAKGMLDSVTAAKVAVLTKSQFNVFFQYIAPEQLEAKYGGKLTDPVTYWPPVNTLNKTPYTLDKDYIQGKDHRKSIDLSGKGKKSQVVHQEQDSNELNDSSETVYYDFETVIWSWPDLDEEDDHNIDELSSKKFQDVSKQGHYSIFASPQLNPKHRRRNVDDSLDRSDSSIASEKVIEGNDRLICTTSFKRSVTFAGGPQLKSNKSKISTFGQCEGAQKKKQE